MANSVHFVNSPLAGISLFLLLKRNVLWQVPVTAAHTCYVRLLRVKAAKYEIQKPSTCRPTLFRCKFWVNVSPFSPCVINLPRNKNMSCGLKKFVAKSRMQVYFEQESFGIVARFSSNSQPLTQQIWSCCPASLGFLYLVYGRLKELSNQTL